MAVVCSAGMVVQWMDGVAQDYRRGSQGQRQFESMGLKYWQNDLGGEGLDAKADPPCFTACDLFLFCLRSSPLDDVLHTYYKYNCML